MTVGAIQKKQDYRQKIGNTVLGLVLALGSWLILNTISPKLAEDISIGIPFVSLSGDEPDPNWAEGNAADGTLLCKNKKYHHKLNGQNIVKGLTMWPGDSNQRTQLQASGISINTPNNCIGSGYGAGCTSLYFESSINTSVINQLTSMKQACDSATDNGVCDIKITGGSECWLHSSHGPQKRIVDISANDANFNNWVVSVGTVSGTGSNAQPDENGFPNNKKTYKISGYGKFLAEVIGQTGNTTAKHWHITLD